ncbi:MAG: hypothetical protein FJZ13_02030 [Candidatus Omnitrophica bacterium]|nr:hypothetical protein [Candidatus Omnitrophota bacterium]
MLSKDEKKELKELASSSKLRNDMQAMLKMRHNPFMIDGKVDLDKFLEFLNEYNYFINHNPKIFSKIIDNDMRL